MSNSKPAHESTLPDFFQVVESQEFKDLVPTLPTENALLHSQMSDYQYEGFWHFNASLQGTLNLQKYYQARDSDIILVSNPKSGTTWLKSILYALINRATHPPTSRDHPLITKNSHELVLSLEFDLYRDHNQLPAISTLPSPCLFSTHLPIVSLPKSVNTDTHCRIVYISRESKDTFNSHWHHTNKIRSSPDAVSIPLQEAFDVFCKGRNYFGPFWDHILGYWNASLERPDKVLFLKYEELKGDPSSSLKRIAEFLGCPFTVDEERAGIVDGILRLCSFDNLSNLEENKSGMLLNGLANNQFFRKGEVGDWKNYLTPEMDSQIDQITEHKFYGTGLKF